MSETSFRKRTHAVNIFDYVDYRQYLRDFYEFRKAERHGFSYRQFADAANLVSPSSLKRVMDGERNLGQASVGGIIKATSLMGAKAEYFRALVKMNQAKDGAAKAAFLEEMLKLMPHARRRELKPEMLEYLADWLRPTLREMVNLADFDENPYAIARRLEGACTVGQITEALQFLIKNGFVTRDAAGRLGSTDSMVVSSDEIKEIAICRFHIRILQQCQDAVQKIAVEQREFAAMTLRIDEEALPELKKRIKAFRNEIFDWAHSEAKTARQAVVQLNIQMYPQTKIGDTIRANDEG